MSELERKQLILTQLKWLKQKRTWICQNFLFGSISIQDTLISLDQNGRKLKESFYMAKVYSTGKLS